MSVKILEGDALTVLRTLPDQSVQMCVTSPPYFGLRDYGVSGQLGLEKTPQLYVEAMVAVFQEVKRVLRDDGTLWLNIGDSYAANRTYQVASTKGGAKHSPAQGMLGASVVPEGCKPKDLIGIPWMLAFALRADGWYLRSDIIWAKPNPMPESVTDRPTKSHEYLFLLTKSATYYYDADAIAEDALFAEDLRAGAGRIAYGGKRNGVVGTGQKSFVSIKTKRNRRSVWTVNTTPYSEAHFATFPPKLIEPCILAGSARQACEKCGAPWERDVERETNWQARRDAGAWAGNVGVSDTYQNGVHGKGMSHDLGGGRTQQKGFKPTCDCENQGTGKSIVLDPFGGAGTTGLVADRLGRDAILIELNPEYAAMARKRITDDAGMFGEVA